VYTNIAARFHRIRPEDVTPQQRQEAKARCYAVRFIPRAAKNHPVQSTGQHMYAAFIASDFAAVEQRVLSHGSPYGH
jgi:hypothetical protein